MGKKVDIVFQTLKPSTIILLDTSPVGLVTDTLLIAKYADSIIYVARANFLEKQMLYIPNNYKSKNYQTCVLLNDTDSKNGYGYGYGYSADSESYGRNGGAKTGIQKLL
jgi:hypothetical protein